MNFSHLQPAKILITRQVTCDFYRLNLVRISLIIPLPNNVVFPEISGSGNVVVYPAREETSSWNICSNPA
jgi:hypothetical protein